MPPPPVFYLGKRVPYYCLTGTANADSLRQEIGKKDVVPNYVVMMNRKNFEERKARLIDLFPGMVYCTDIEPSLIDRLLHLLNPRHNINEQYALFRAPGMKEEKVKRIRDKG